MKNILVIVESYHHRPNPNGICMEKVVNELINRDNSVTVFTTKTIYEQCDYESIEGAEVYSFDRSFGDKLRLVASVKKGIGEKILSVLSDFWHRFWLLISFNKWPQRSLSLWRKYLHKAKQLNVDKKFDSVVSVYMGIDEVIAGYKFKKANPECEFTVYTLDAMSGRRYPRLFGTEVCLKSIQRWEKTVFAETDNLCIMSSHILHYQKKKYDYIRNKIRVMDIPLFVPRNSSENTSESNSDFSMFKIVYTGAALVETGNPLFFTEHILSSVENCELHLYGRIAPSIKEKLENSSLYNSRLFVHGLVSAQEIQSIQQEANCLITFGSDNPNMIPCKIFEYFATRKPVINVYYSSADSAYPYIKRYGYSLQLSALDSDEDNCQKLRCFLEDISTMQCPDLETLTREFWDNTPFPMAELLSM